ncbi:MAG TPA: DUF2808 domain-containing protein [Cyanophyceae cyanobacterium]
MFKIFPKSTALSQTARILCASGLFLSVLLPTALFTLPSAAVELANGQTFFNRSPRLIRATASNKTANTPSTYQFTIAVPADAGEPLQAVTITQKPNVEQIDFNVSNSSAFIGDNLAGGLAIPLASIGGSEPSDSNEVTVVFDHPVAPGNSITVSLDVKQNPVLGGIYQFGVTAFSPGENSSGLYLGSAAIHLQGSN